MNGQTPIFVFSEQIQAGIDAGKYAVITSKDGIQHGVAREIATGRIVGHAKQLILDGHSLDPVGVFPQFTDLSQRIGILQATTAAIGVGVAANVAISAVNLYQTFKLREDVKQMRSEMNQGFLDLKTILKDQGDELLAHIDRVAEDVEFRHHRTILSRAYAQFSHAVQRLQTALSISDPTRRDAEMQSARNMMAEALKDYENPDLLNDVSTPGYIRRRECVWAIRQAIAYSFQLQDEYQSSQDCLAHLDTIIRQDLRRTTQFITNEAELDFLFPEILHIQNHDLTALKLWQAQITWLQELPIAEVQQLKASGLTPLTLPKANTGEPLEIPAAQIEYEAFKAKSHYAALKDQLLLLVEPELREVYTTTIYQSAQQQQLHSLTPANLKDASDFTIANLHNYFQPRKSTNLAPA